MEIVKRQAFRGDTIGIPVNVSFAPSSTIRIHLRQTPDSDFYHILQLSNNTVIIPDTVSSQCSGIWMFDIEITTANGIVYTHPQRYVIDFITDITRVYGSEAPTGTSDLERKVIIAEEYWVRLPNGEVIPIGAMDEHDPIFEASPAAGIASEDITNWNDAYANRLIIGEGDRYSDTDAGLLREMSFTDDYLYICVKAGTAGNAIWKRALLFHI